MGKRKDAVEMTGSIKLKTVVQSDLSRNSLITWEIPDYGQLESGRLYFRKHIATGMSCVYMFIRYEQCLHVAIQCPHVRRYDKFYFGSKEVARQAVTERLGGELYAGKLSDLHSWTGPLTVCFKFLREIETEIEEYDPDETVPLPNTDELCAGLQFLFLSARDADFKIFAEGVSMRAHRCVLYARSNFFMNLLDKVAGVREFTTREIPPVILHLVLVYMYGGGLPELDAPCMVDVYCAAYLLAVPSLKGRCSAYFEERPWHYHYVEGKQFFQYEVQNCGIVST